MKFNWGAKLILQLRIRRGRVEEQGTGTHCTKSATRARGEKENS